MSRPSYPLLNMEANNGAVNWAGTIFIDEPDARRLTFQLAPNIPLFFLDSYKNRREERRIQKE